MMADLHISESAERPHAPSGEANWEESWYFDFVSANGDLAGYARLALRPAERRSWWWSAVVGTGLPYVLVREHDVELPRAGTFEVRGPGLWAEPVCETPFEHWGLGLEAFAVGLDDPVDSYGDERGESVPLGFDLEWEPDVEPVVSMLSEGHGQYAQTGPVHGEVLVGRQRWALAGTGTTSHAWGPRDWWPVEPAPGWVSGRFEDGTPVAGTADVMVDESGLVEGGRVVVPGGGELHLWPVHHAPLQIPSPDGRVSRLARAACRLEAPDERGGTGWGWAERLQPA